MAKPMSKSILRIQRLAAILSDSGLESNWTHLPEEHIGCHGRVSAVSARVVCNTSL